MKRKLANALDYVDGKYIAEAAHHRRRRPLLKIAVAAVLVGAMLWNTPTIPLVVSAKAVSLASDSRKMERPNIHSDKFDQWFDEERAREAVVTGAVDPIATFAERCSREVLRGVDNTNRLWSPINAYLALAMTAELTAGATQEEVLAVLGSQNSPNCVKI